MRRVILRGELIVETDVGVAWDKFALMADGDDDTIFSGLRVLMNGGRVVGPTATEIESVADEIRVRDRGRRNGV